MVISSLVKNTKIAICLHMEIVRTICFGMPNPSFSAVMNLLRAHARLEQRFGGELGAVHGLASKEMLLLMQLERPSRARLSRVDLAKRLSTSPSTITRTTIPLEKLGLVGRETDARDARLAYVVLTGRGSELIANARATRERLSAEMFRDRWTKQEIACLAEFLSRMTAGEPGDLSK
jgi:DNA-binding MarR family transcriptional regulator